MKINKFNLINIIFSMILCMNYTLPIRAETTLEEIKKTGLLKVGIRSDVIPFGYRDNDNELRGICLDFIASLKEQLKSEINRNIITVKILISTLYNRFEIVEDKLVHLECGPNTIREISEYNVDFSQAFFVTGAKLLMTKELANSFNNGDNLNGLTIGVLRYTTTEEFMKNKYPNAKLEFFQGVKGSLRAIQAVQQGRIDGFANDGILLIGESILLRVPLNEDYTLIPKNPLTCEEYGLILPNNDPSWRYFVNSVINSTEDKQILKEWFPTFSDELNETQEFCKKDS